VGDARSLLPACPVGKFHFGGSGENESASGIRRFPQRHAASRGHDRGRGGRPASREPGGLRLGLSPLSTSFEEVHRGLEITRHTLRSLLTERAGLA
jgi:hypothetical protein